VGRFEPIAIDFTVLAVNIFGPLLISQYAFFLFFHNTIHTKYIKLSHASSEVTMKIHIGTMKKITADDIRI
jgi:hypothetical protein